MNDAMPKPVFRQWLLFAVALGVLAYALYVFAPRQTSAVLSSAGAILFLMWLTPLCLALIDGVGMRIMLTRLGHARPLREIFALRFSLEAVASTAPLGPVAADASLPFIFGRGLTVPVVDGIAVVAARKWALLAGHAIAVSIALAFAYRGIRGITIPGIDAPLSLVLALVATTLAVCVLAIRSAVRATTIPKDTSSQPISKAGPITRIRRAITSAAAGARTILAPRDGGATRLALLYTCLWLVEVCDTFVLLRILGAPVDFRDALIVEMVASIAKSAAFVSPGGLGAQDAAYVFSLGAVAGPASSAMAVAYVVVRRLRELCFVVLGFMILALVPFFRRRLDARARPTIHEALSVTGRV